MQKIVFFFFLFLLFLLKNLILPAERRRFLKNKNRKKQKTNWTDFQLKKGQFLDGFSTLQHKSIRKFPIKVHRERGQNFPIFISCRYLVELGPRQLGLPVADQSWERSPKNEFPGPLGPGAKKAENGVEKESKSTVFQLFCLFFDSVFDFFGPRGREAPGTHFRTPFPTLGPSGQTTPVAGPGNPNKERCS